jgi:hypothetical protein
MAHEAVDRHANGPQRDRLALRELGKDGTVCDFTYSDLKEQSNRFANVLASVEVGKGDRVFTLAGRLPLHRRAGHPEARERFLPPVCRLWPGTDLSAFEPG